MATPQPAAKDQAVIPPNEFTVDDDPLATGEDLTVEVEQEEAESEESPGTKAAENEAELEARQSGWVSKEEWVETHGSDRGWKSAPDYVDFRRAFVPILSKENKELREKIKKLEERDSQRALAEEDAKRNFERSSLQLDLRQARENSDWDKVDEIANKLLDLKLAEKPKAVSPTQTIDPEVQRDYMEFESRNPWIKTDKRLAQNFAVELKAIMDVNPGTPVADALDMARDRTRRLYPEKFPAMRRSAMAESDGDSNSTPRRTVSWNQLKPDVRQIYDKFISDTPGVTKEMLLKRFAAENPEFFRS